MAQVVSASEVRRLLDAEGWSCVHATSTSLVFRGPEGRLCTVPCHPMRPDQILLCDLLQNVPVLRQHFVSMAKSDASEDAAGFEILIAAGQVTNEDLKTLFSAFSRLNQALGGAGLSFRQAEKIVR